MANYTIIGGDQKEYGPIPEAQLRQWIADGRANAHSRARVEGATEWRPLSDFPEFQDLLKSAVPPPLPATAAKTSGLAITSLVLGILGLVTCGITILLSAPIGLILGIVSITKIGKSQGQLKGRGLALAGIITSGVSLLLIPIFAAMMLPALAAAKQKAQEINCVNNEKQLALAVRIYAGDNGDHFPPAATWCDAIHTAVGAEKVFKCPAAPAGSRCDYAFNAKLDGLAEGSVNPRTVMLFETEGGWNASGGPELMIGKARHARMFVVAFADGSVQQLRESQLNTLRWDP
jgi:prepilin-type processing-associated H-X9-DG protein